MYKKMTTKGFKMLLSASKIFDPFIRLLTFLLGLIIVVTTLIVENFSSILDTALKIFGLLLLAYYPIWGIMFFMLIIGAF